MAAIESESDPTPLQLETGDTVAAGIGQGDMLGDPAARVTAALGGSSTSSGSLGDSWVVVRSPGVGSPTSSGSAVVVVDVQELDSVSSEADAPSLPAPAEPEKELDSVSSEADAPSLPAPAEPEKEATTSIEDVIAKLESEWGHCVGLYVHGSTIFVNRPPADLDLLAIIDEPTLRPVVAATKESQFTLGRFEVSVFTRSFWLQKMEAMDLTMLTCLSLPARFVLKELDDDRMRNCKVDLPLLEESIISYAEYTWLKAERVLDRWKDVYKSSKNAYFVFRVIEFGCQLAEHGRIENLQAANPLWAHIDMLYKSLNVQPGDWNVMEVALGSKFLSEIERFRSKMADAKRRAGLVPADQEVVTAPRRTRVKLESMQSCVCAICLDALHGGEDDALASEEERSIALANCGHAFHLVCVARSVRGQTLATCPVCRGSVRVKIDKQHALDRELNRRGVEVRSRTRTRFAGYPATIRLPGEPSDPDEVADTETSPTDGVVEAQEPSEAIVSVPELSEAETETVVEGHRETVDPAPQRPEPEAQTVLEGHRETVDPATQRPEPEAETVLEASPLDASELDDQEQGRQ